MAGSLRLVRAPDVYELRVYVGRDLSGRGEAPSRALHRQQACGPTSPCRFRRRGRASQGEQRRTCRLLVIEHDTDSAFAAWKLNGWQDLSPSTTRRYESIWQVHVEGSLGKRKISELSSYDLERYFRKLKSEGAAEASVRQIRAVLNRTCRLARRWSGGGLAEPGRRDRASQLVDGRRTGRAGA